MKNQNKKSELLTSYNETLNSIRNHLKRISKENPIKVIEFYQYSFPEKLKAEKLSTKDLEQIKVVFLDGSKEFKYLLTNDAIYIADSSESIASKIKGIRGGDLNWNFKRMPGKPLFVIKNFKLKASNLKIDDRILHTYVDTLTDAEDKQILDGEATLTISRAFKVCQTENKFCNGITEKRKHNTYMCFGLERELPKKHSNNFRMPVNAFDITAQIESLEKLSKEQHMIPLYKLISEVSIPIQIDSESVKLKELEFINNKKDQDNVNIVEAVNQQISFVKKALASPDIAILEGPPGSGKTTVISELVNQVSSLEKKVLLCAPTHVAIDNVIEKIMEKQQSKKSSFGIIPMRITGNPNKITSQLVKQVSTLEGVVKYLLGLNQNEFGMLFGLKENEIVLLSSKNSDLSEHELSLKEAIFKNCESKVSEKINLVGGTMTGYKSQVLKHNLPVLYDYLIVDEASKATFGLALVPAQSALKWIYIGDPQQLSPFFDKDLAELVLRDTYSRRNTKEDVSVFSEVQNLYDFKEHSELVEKHKYELQTLIKAGDYSKDNTTISEVLNKVMLIGRQLLPSFLEITMTGYPDVLKKTGVLKDDKYSCTITNDFNRFQSLDYTFRMGTELAKIPQKYFYNGLRMKSLVPEKALKDLQPDNVVSHLERPLSWINTSLTTERNSVSEINCVIKTINRLQHIAASQEKNKPSVMIICFYKEQKHQLKGKISEWLNNGNYLDEFDGKEGIQVHTVDSAQGKEADYVLLCFTKHHEDAFYNVSNRLNVALTRAKGKLVIFANHEFMSQIKSKPISELANQCVPFQGFK